MTKTASEPDVAAASSDAANAALARAKARIGTELPAVRFEIDRSDLRRYARACGETWPGYVQGDEAPPTFISALQSEGMGGDLFERDVPFKSMLHSDDAVELVAAIRPGDVLFATSYYRDAVLKQSRRGPMLFQTAEMLLRDEAGQLVGRVASSLVSF
ncbi:MaoC family dehydratase N-terminal domain-containing protein [Novosphingobium sp.]|uniref:FAS1-like dehydratase domain-containing protein n=1 Tax=Novosphingobium sp. TaxID=1874826 RepID=UPI0025E9D974|nr:MaoC family dehydratase N-terminal domain-containing protein [Novosphingobium sp.]